jgi:N-acetylmuramoyl-L-alanine amidase
MLEGGLEIAYPAMARFPAVSVAIGNKGKTLSSILARRKEFKERRAILRGVYEENLRMVLRGCHRPKCPKRFLPKRIQVYVLVCLFLLLIYNQDSGTSSSSRLAESLKRPSEDLIRSPRDRIVAEAPPINSENAAEFRSLQNRGPVPLSRMFGLGIQRIVIDAGHGGTDLGTSGKMGTLEKDITLDIAKQLKACLNSSGFSRVYMTRVDDSVVSLQERVAFTRKAKADLFLSIHLNSLPNTPANVIETFYFGPSTDPGALKLADQENKGSEYGLSDFREVVEKLGRTMKLQESRKLAESIQASLFGGSKEQNPNIINNGVKRAPFAVLIGPDVPSVLAEVSCLSNAREERELNSEKHRKNIAEYLAAGVASYLNMGASENDSKR